MDDILQRIRSVERWMQDYVHGQMEVDTLIDHVQQFRTAMRIASVAPGGAKELRAWADALVDVAFDAKYGDAAPRAALAKFSEVFFEIEMMCVEPPKKRARVPTPQHAKPAKRARRSRVYVAPCSVRGVLDPACSAEAVLDVHEALLYTAQRECAKHARKCDDCRRAWKEPHIALAALVKMSKNDPTVVQFAEAAREHVLDERRRRTVAADANLLASLGTAEDSNFEAEGSL